MNTYKANQDAFGQALYDHFRGHETSEVIERDDGRLDVGAPTAVYFGEFKRWPELLRRAVALARGRILDIGCGAGRVALHLQQKGLDVVGVDISTLAIKVCRLRGLRKARALSIADVTRKLGVFDTLLLLGNNFGLCGSCRQTQLLLRRFYGMTTARAQIIAQTFDPYVGASAHDRAYQRRNERRGRLGGQIRMRVRYRMAATPWFDYLFVSKAELARIVSDTGWRIARCIDGERSRYVAVLEKADCPTGARVASG